MAPKGHRKRQKARKHTTHRTAINVSSSTFQEKRVPVIVRRNLFLKVRGRPASKVPAGQMNLQKPGASFQSGIRMTKTARRMYFRWERTRVARLLRIFGEGSLCKSSCRRPTGQRKPQIKRPRKRPIRRSVPRI